MGKKGTGLGWERERVGVFGGGGGGGVWMLGIEVYLIEVVERAVTRVVCSEV